MPRTVILKEAQAPYILSLEEATLSQETVILEREGRPVAVVVPSSLSIKLSSVSAPRTRRRGISNNFSRVCVCPHSVVTAPQ